MVCGLFLRMAYDLPDSVRVEGASLSYFTPGSNRLTRSLSITSYVLTRSSSLYRCAETLSGYILSSAAASQNYTKYWRGYSCSSTHQQGVGSISSSLVVSGIGEHADWTSCSRFEWTRSKILPAMFSSVSWLWRYVNNILLCMKISHVLFITVVYSPVTPPPIHCACNLDAPCVWPGFISQDVVSGILVSYKRSSVVDNKEDPGSNGDQLSLVWLWRTQKQHH